MLGNVKALSYFVGHVFVLRFLGLTLLRQRWGSWWWKVWEPRHNLILHRPVYSALGPNGIFSHRLALLRLELLLIYAFV